MGSSRWSSGSAAVTSAAESLETSELVRRNRERELMLLQDALNGKVLGDDARDVFMRRYLACRSHEQQLLHDVNCDKQVLQQVLDAVV